MARKHVTNVTAVTGTTGDRLLTVSEASAMLGVKRSTLYAWAYERRVPTVKLFSKALRFRLSDIEKLIKQSVRPPRRAFDDQENQLDS